MKPPDDTKPGSDPLSAGGSEPGVSIGSSLSDSLPLVAAFLARYDAAESRKAMGASLRAIVALMPAGASVEAFPWHLLRRAHCQALRAKLAARYAPSSARRHLSALRGILREAWRLGLMSTDDYQRAKDIDAIRGERLSEGIALSPDDVERMYETAVTFDPPLAQRHALLLSLAFYCGLRRAELADAEWSWVRNGVLRVLGKGNKERDVPLNEIVLAHLGAWIKLRGDAQGPLLQAVDAGGHITGRRVSASTVEQDLLRLAAHVEKFSPHDTRRTFISTLLENGVDLATVQRLAGHLDPKTTAGYDRRGLSAAREAVESLGLTGMGLSSVRAPGDMCVCNHPVKRHRDSAPSPCRIRDCICARFKFREKQP